MNKKGETLLEVLIALTLITVSAAAAASAMISATKGLSLSKNYLIAQNLASEGLEVVKNIRDTNWMKFPTAKEECWLNKNPVAADSGDCEPLEYTDGGNNDYYIEIDADKKWTLKQEDQKTMGETVAAVPDAVYGLELIEGKYSFSATPKYYRGIRILDTSDETIVIQAIVKWNEGTKPYEIKGTEILTNYL